jgi:acyl-CoA thioester hydrolase
LSLAWPVRVYIEDTDFGGVVYYANYLRWFERARTEWLRARGHSQAAVARDLGILFSVVSVQVDYRRPARLDDELVVTCEPRKDGRASVRFAQRILRGDELLAEAEVRVACLAVGSLRPTRLPDFVLAEVG